MNTNQTRHMYGLRLGPSLRVVALLALACMLVARSSPAQDTDRDDTKRRYHFEFEFDADSLSGALSDLMIDPPDLSALEDLKFEFNIPDYMRYLDRPRIRGMESRKIAGLERESRQLAREARRAEGAERRQLEAQLRSKLEEIFTEKLEVRRKHIQRLEERLQEQRSQLQEREQKRNEIIDRRYRQLLGEDDALDW